MRSFITVLFSSLDVLDPRVGHTRDVLSPFLSVILIDFHGQSCTSRLDGFMTHVTRRLTAKNRDQLRNPMLGNRVWAAFYHKTSIIFVSPFISKVSRRASSFFLSVQLSQPYVANLLQGILALSLVVSSSKSVFCDFSIFLQWYTDTTISQQTSTATKRIADAENIVFQWNVFCVFCLGGNSVFQSWKVVQKH